MNSLDWVLIGECAVDSGALILIDPCYVDDSNPVSYEKLIGPIDAADEDPKQLIAPIGPGATFVRLSNFGGDLDGRVYIRRSQKGLVVAAMVVFDEDYLPNE